MTIKETSGKEFADVNIPNIIVGKINNACEMAIHSPKKKK